MTDKKKSKSQLIAELEVLRKTASQLNSAKDTTYRKNADQSLEEARKDIHNDSILGEVL
jgi:hypothetical protein